MTKVLFILFKIKFNNNNNYKKFLISFSVFIVTSTQLWDRAPLMFVMSLVHLKLRETPI